MENLSNAIFMSFTIIALIIGLSFGLYLINDLNSVADVLIKSNDSTSEYELISYDSSNIKKQGSSSLNGGTNSRMVSADIVISTLYRYFLEDFSVEIYYSGSSTPAQIFDLNIEKILFPDDDSIESKVYNRIYGKNGICNLFGAPWITRTDYTKLRVDMFVSSLKGYINGTEVDYTGNGLKAHLNSTFKEDFIQYTFDGETISSDDEGEEIETITGSRRAQNKILIRYKEN